MKIVAVAVLVLGVSLMSAPLVLPRLGLMVPGDAPAVPAAGVGLADLGRALTDGMASVRGYLGESSAAEGARLPQPGSAAPADVAAQLVAACAELARAAQADPAACAAAAGAGGGFDPAAMAGAAAGASAAAATRGTGATVTRRQAAGAKFVRVDKATP